LCEISSSKNQVISAYFDLPKSHYSEDHILAPKGCCAPKFLHALENDQVLLAHSSPETGAPLQLFSKRGQKMA